MIANACHTLNDAQDEVLGAVGILCNSFALQVFPKSVLAPRLLQRQRRAQCFRATWGDAEGGTGPATLHPAFCHHFCDGGTPCWLKVPFRQFAVVAELLQGDPLDMSGKMAWTRGHISVGCCSVVE